MLIFFRVLWRPWITPSCTWVSVGLLVWWFVRLVTHSSLVDIQPFPQHLTQLGSRKLFFFVGGSHTSKTIVIEKLITFKVETERGKRSQQAWKITDVCATNVGGREVFVGFECKKRGVEGWVEQRGSWKKEQVGACVELKDVVLNATWLDLPFIRR